jgi:glycerol uptake facilitator-like aquaporin
VWTVLVVATGLTYAAGEFGSPGRALIATVLLLACGKGALVILDFMELRHAPPLWRRVVLGWLFAVVAGILLAYLKGTP